MAKGDYQERLKSRTNAYISAAESTQSQYDFDIMIVCLTDEDIMGDKVFSRKEAEEFAKAWQEMYLHFELSIKRHPEADYWQEKLDSRLRDIMGDDLIPFQKRYEYLHYDSYGKNR